MCSSYKETQLKIISCFPFTKTWCTAVNHSVQNAATVNTVNAKLVLQKDYCEVLPHAFVKIRQLFDFIVLQSFALVQAIWLNTHFLLFIISKESLSETQQSAITGQFCHQFHWTPSQIPDVFIFENT